MWEKCRNDEYGTCGMCRSRFANLGGRVLNYSISISISAWLLLFTYLADNSYQARVNACTSMSRWPPCVAVFPPSVRKSAAIAHTFVIC